MGKRKVDAMQANALRMLQDNAKAQGSTPGNPRNSIADATESTDGYTVLTRSQISHRKATASIHLRSLDQADMTAAAAAPAPAAFAGCVLPETVLLRISI